MEHCTAQCEKSQERYEFTKELVTTLVEAL